MRRVRRCDIETLVDTTLGREELRLAGRKRSLTNFELHMSHMS